MSVRFTLRLDVFEDEAVESVEAFDLASGRPTGPRGA